MLDVGCKLTQPCRWSSFRG